MLSGCCNLVKLEIMRAVSSVVVEVKKGEKKTRLFFVLLLLHCAALLLVVKEMQRSVVFNAKFVLAEK